MRTYEKPFGQIAIEFIPGEKKVSIKYAINGGKSCYAYGLDETKKALILIHPFLDKPLKIEFGGKIHKVGGIALPDFDEVKKEFDAMSADLANAAKIAKEEKIESIKSGAQPIKACWREGEYLSGHIVYGEAAELLEEINAANYVSGWGYCVNPKVIGALGEEFTYQQAVDFMQPANSAKAAKIAKNQAELDAKFIEAAATGKKVLIKSWMSDCHDKTEDCSFDENREYAMPDGTRKIEWSHCW